MNKKFLFRTLVLTGLSIFTMQSCVKKDDFSVPPINCANAIGAPNKTLSDLAAVGKVTPTQADIIATDFIVEGYVSSSDESGNLYKVLYVQDQPTNPTQAIEIDIDGASLYTNYPLGAKVRINAKGLLVQTQNGNVKLGSYDPSYPIGRINPNLLSKYMSRVCGNDGYPVTATMVPVEFASFAEAQKPQNVNKLVKITGVQFKDDVTGMGTSAAPNTFVDQNPAPASGASDRALVDIAAGSMVIRNSSYANFAKTLMRPTYEGSGSVTMILGLYTSASGNKTWQGYIRDLNDLKLTNPRLNPVSIFYDPFDALTNWTAVNVLGAQVWGITQFGNPKPSAYISGGGTTANEDWLVSKQVSLTGSTNYYLSFESDGRYAGNPLKLYVTTNYTGSPATTTWVELNPIFDTDMAAFGGFVNSGLLNLNSYAGGNVVFAFKYTSTTTAGSAWEVDNFRVIGL